MIISSVTHSLAKTNPPAVNDVEEALCHVALQYSLRHLLFAGNISEENLVDALQKSVQVCCFLGINSQHHFKKVFVFDAQMHAVYIDWLMSKRGFNLVVMQIPTLNATKARWMWQLTGL